MRLCLANTRSYSGMFISPKHIKLFCITKACHYSHHDNTINRDENVVSLQQHGFMMEVTLAFILDIPQRI